MPVNIFSHHVLLNLFLVFKNGFNLRLFGTFTWCYKPPPRGGRIAKNSSFYEGWVSIIDFPIQIDFATTKQLKQLIRAGKLIAHKDVNTKRGPNASESARCRLSLPTTRTEFLVNVLGMCWDFVVSIKKVIKQHFNDMVYMFVVVISDRHLQVLETAMSLCRKT